MGPCTKPNQTPWLTGTPTAQGPGSPSVFRDEKGDTWLALHSWVGGKVGYPQGARNLFVVRFTINPQGQPVLTSPNVTLPFWRQNPHYAVRLTPERVVGEDEALDGVGEAFVLVAGRDVVGGGLHLGARVAHGDAEAGRREHEDVVRHVADGRDLLGRDVVVLRQVGDDATLVRLRVRDVEVVGL